MIDVPDALSRLEQPEYTGENRCRPCTVVNVAIALALAVVIGGAGSALAGAIALGAFLTIIALRGYLIPGTPALTRRYLPERVLEAVGKSAASGPTIETLTPVELTRVLTAAGVASDRGGAVRLTSAFRTRWNERLSSDGADDPDAVAVGSALGVDEIERVGDASFELEGRRQVRWESTAALAADVAAATELRSRLDGWDALGADERRDALTGLRLLRADCPVCGGPISSTVERLEHCCRQPRVAVRATCEACDRPVVDLVVSESNAEPWLELAGVPETHLEAEG
ncbi:hypothetical protein [Natronorubrum halophilum]|uniref:hypothetical protein n=1 Tax=Natronorubrum halophilum TaxID=1702106 RepID=UPI000EF65B18|nr:hypothetical protein [Natronorubrum halophilum]